MSKGADAGSQEQRLASLKSLTYIIKLEKLPMTKEEYVAILDNYLKKPDAKERVKRMTESQPEKASVGMFLMYALSDTFPCSSVTTPPPLKAGSP